MTLVSAAVLTACTTYRAYTGDARPPNKVALVECATEGVAVLRLDDYEFSGGWSEFEVLPGKHRLEAELYWRRLDRVVEMPKQTASFVAKPGQKYSCVFDVDERKKAWKLAVVPNERVSWQTRTFHGARSWRTPAGECVRWDPASKGCLGDPGTENQDEPKDDETWSESAGGANGGAESPSDGAALETP